MCSVVAGLALVFERWRYTRRRDSSGGDWVATGEKFVDPTSGERFEVFYDPLSGQRDYRPTPR